MGFMRTVAHSGLSQRCKAARSRRTSRFEGTINDVWFPTETRTVIPETAARSRTAERSADNERSAEARPRGARAEHRARARPDHTDRRPDRRRPVHPAACETFVN
eukprot:2343864-Prymnesium_polylepis.1